MKHCIINYSIILSFFIVSYFSNLFAMSFEEELTMKKNNVLSQKEKCIEAKQNGFKDQDPVFKFSNLYLNALLDYILDNNKKILKDEGLENQKFCIEVSDKEDEASRDRGYGLIVFHITHLMLEFEEDDSDIASIISHELAHDILNHVQLTFNTLTDIHNKFMSDNKVKDKTPFNFKQYCKNDSKFKDQQKEFEEKADTLGFKLYLNSKFVPQKYGIFFLKLTEYTMYPLFSVDKSQSIFSNLSDKDFELFKYISTVKGCWSTGVELNNRGQFSEFMNKIKYIPNYNDYHPTACWRFWNIVKEYGLYDNASLKDNTVLNTVLLKINLNKYKHLNIVKDLTKKNEPKLLKQYMSDILSNVISNNSSSTITYSVDTTIKNDGFHFYNEENFLALRFYDSVIKPLVESSYKL